MERPNQSSDELEISLADVLYSIWDVRWIVIVLTLLGGIAGFALSAGGMPAYETKASMLVTARNADGTYQNGTGNPRSEDIYLSQNLTKTVQLLATSNRVVKQILEMEGITNIQPEDLKSQISIKAEDGTSFLWLSLSWEDEALAVKLVNRLVDVLPGVMMEVMDIGSVNVIDKAEAAVRVQGKTPRNGVVGAMLGLVSGCVIGVVYYLFVPKVRGNSSLESLSLDVIGELPLFPKGKKGFNGYLDEGVAPFDYKEAYGRLCAVFRYLTEQKDKRIIAVTSSGPGEGKSTIAYNLALQLNGVGNKVLLLDFDFKKGSLYQLVKTKKPKDGDVRRELRNGEELDKLVEKMYNGIYTIQGFSEKDVFQVENKIYPAIREMKSRFDYILIDTPPVGVLSDVQQMRGLMEGVLLVIRKDNVSVGAVSEAVTFLEQAGIPITGCVLNGGKGNKRKIP